MARYALLVLPATNRVYAGASARLTIAELEVFNHAVLGGRLHTVSETVIAGVRYVCFEADALTGRDADFLANLSSVYTLFRREGDLFAPIELRSLDTFDDDLITIQKYQGKTNEHFTKLLLNVTLLATSWADQLLERRFAVLDPLCGRGTTLNQALMYGFDAAGLDIDQRDFDVYTTFIGTWLKRKRLKHSADTTRVRHDRAVIGRRFQASIGVTKRTYKAGDSLKLSYVNADTTKALDFYQPATFDAIATDAPYGVQHGSRSDQGLRRSPLALIASAAPVWARLLRPGGALGLAWNVNVAGRDEVCHALTQAGLDVVDAAAYHDFRHRVDQAVVRDILVARRAP
jgi:SAM-dependent methyltransferase